MSMQVLLWVEMGLLQYRRLAEAKLSRSGVDTENRSAPGLRSAIPWPAAAQWLAAAGQGILKGS